MRCPVIAGGSHDLSETMGSHSQRDALKKHGRGLKYFKRPSRGGRRPTQGIFHSTAGSQKLLLPTSFVQLLLVMGLRCYVWTNILADSCQHPCLHPIISGPLAMPGIP